MRWEIKDPYSTWRWWFAWRPVRTLSGYRVWGEVVYRRKARGIESSWIYETPDILTLNAMKQTPATTADIPGILRQIQKDLESL